MHLGGKHAPLVLLVRLRFVRRAHPRVVEARAAPAGAALLGVAAVHFVAEHVLRDGEQPRREPHAALGVEALDRVGEGGERVLGEIAQRLLAESPIAPARERSADHRAEGLPQLEPGALVACPEATQEGGVDLMHGELGVHGDSVSEPWSESGLSQESPCSHRFSAWVALIRPVGDLDTASPPPQGGRFPLLGVLDAACSCQRTGRHAPRTASDRTRPCRVLHPSARRCPATRGSPAGAGPPGPSGPPSATASGS
jgi:hypothetical protein